MGSDSLQKALNGQIVVEQYSANLYFSISPYLEKECFKGFLIWKRDYRLKKRITPVEWQSTPSGIDEKPP